MSIIPGIAIGVVLESMTMSHELESREITGMVEVSLYVIYDDVRFKLAVLGKKEGEVSEGNEGQV